MHTCVFFVISLQSESLRLLISYSLGHAATCTHFYVLAHTRLHSLYSPANPHYPSVLTESFSSPGHRKGSPAASQTLTCSNTTLPFFTLFLWTPSDSRCLLCPHPTPPLPNYFSVCSGRWSCSVKLLSASIW